MSDLHFNELYRKFEQIALKLVRRGRKHYGSHGIIEYLRFEAVIENRDSEFKISSDYEPLLARIFAIRYPQYAGLFTMKKSRFDDRETWPEVARKLIR